MRADIQRYSAELIETIGNLPLDEISGVADVLLDRGQQGSTIFVLGNGGSAATASHFACDLAKNTRAEGHTPFRVVALTDNVPLLTAWGNDTSYDRVFAEQLTPLVRTGDVVMIISASGNSPNVLAAAHEARLAGATVIALTGRTGGRLASMSDVCVRIPSDSIEQIEDGHLMIGHSLCVALRAHMSSIVHQGGRATAGAR